MSSRPQYHTNVSVSGSGGGSQRDVMGNALFQPNSISTTSHIFRVEDLPARISAFNLKPGEKITIQEGSEAYDNNAIFKDAKWPNTAQTICLTYDADNLVLPIRGSYRAIFNGALGDVVCLISQEGIEYTQYNIGVSDMCGGGCGGCATCGAEQFFGAVVAAPTESPGIEGPFIKFVPTTNTLYFYESGSASWIPITVPTGALTSIAVSGPITGNGTSGSPLDVDFSALSPSDVDDLAGLLAGEVDVSHDSLLTGDGTAASPLTINVPALLGALNLDSGDIAHSATINGVPVTTVDGALDALAALSHPAASVTAANASVVVTPNLALQTFSVAAQVSSTAGNQISVDGTGLFSPLQTATQTPYNGATSGLASTNVQTAIDALDAAIDGLAASASAHPPATIASANNSITVVASGTGNQTFDLQVNTSGVFKYGEAFSGSIDGSNPAFVIASPAISQVAVYRNGLRQSAGTNYSVSGNTVTFLAGSIPGLGDLLVFDVIR